MLNFDNDNTKDVIEMCYRRRKTLVNPIINWAEEDVWQFLNEVAKVPHCELYDQGYTRLGCIGCPMQNSGREAQFKRYPKYRQNYIRAFERMLKERDAAGLTNKGWEDGEDVMQWWLGKKGKEKQLEGQVKMDDMVEAE